MTFAERLRNETNQAHSLAENAAFIRGFLRGYLNVQSYRLMLLGLADVYEAMEIALDRHKQHPVIQQVYHDGLRRKPVMKMDIEYLTQKVDNPQSPQSKAIERYVARIRELEESSPELLVAHSYVRYMGDVSGGQILRKIAAKALKLEGNQGLMFYDFSELGDIAEFKNQYRSGLNSLPVDDSMRDAIVAESIEVFRLNIDFFNELEGSCLVGLWNIIRPTLKKAS
ncbi:MAG: biliverdin-producing heme oxygenase [Verrucomicrobiota bacterium]